MSTEYAHLCECPQPTPYQVGGFLPSSSLSPRALVGEVSSLSPTQTLGGLWAPGVYSLETPLLLGSALRAETLPPPFLSQSKQRETAVGNGTVQPALSPLLPTALSKRGCHQNQEALRGRGFSWAGPRLQVQQLPPPSSSEQESQPRGRGGSMSTPICFFL